EIKEGYELGSIKVQSKSDNSLQLSMNNKSFETFINSKQVYEFRIAFKHAVMPMLKRVYLVEIDEYTSINDFLEISEVADMVEVADKNSIEVLAITEVYGFSSFTILPNNYQDRYSR